MVRFTSFLAAAAAIVGTTSAASAVLDLIPDNFDKIVLKSGKPALVEFFAPWCGHCKSLAPVYEELAQKFEFATDQVTIAKVDADAEKTLGKRFGIQGFPTLKWFDGKSDKPEDYNGGRDLESLSKFISDKTGIKPKAVKTPRSEVKMLSGDSFKTEIGRQKDALVAFTAPWCGHCKSLAPIWEKLAADFASEAGVLIAKVDCEAENAKDLAQELGISSYPTIKYYAKGSAEGVAYAGGRTEEALVEFMNEKASTLRAVGGGLNKIAGLIPSLDELLAKAKEGGASAYTNVSEEAAKLKDKTAEYYSRVAAKTAEQADYATNELKRLQGLIAKGGLTAQKSDLFTTRTNILAKFVGGEDSTTLPKQEL